MCVCERQARYSVRERVRVKGIRHVGVAMLHTIHCVQHATHEEAVAVVTTPEASAKCSYRLKVSRMEVDEQDHFLVEALRVQSRVEQPEARLIHGKLHLEDTNKKRLERSKNLQTKNKFEFFFFLLGLKVAESINKI